MYVFPDSIWRNFSWNRSPTMCKWNLGVPFTHGSWIFRENDDKRRFHEKYHIIQSFYANSARNG